MPLEQGAMGFNKSKVGKDILEDYKLAKMGQSAYYSGAVPLCEPLVCL